MTRYIRHYNKCSQCRPFVSTQAQISNSIHSLPHQQQSAVHQTRNQSDVASVVLSNVSRIDSKWSSSTTCWEFFHQFPSTKTLKLIRMYVLVPSVLWRCWLGGRKGTRPVKNWAVGCWHGYLSGARCRLAYSPADATATHCLLLQ